MKHSGKPAEATRLSVSGAGRRPNAPSASRADDWPMPRSVAIHTAVAAATPRLVRMLIICDDIPALRNDASAVIAAYSAPASAMAPRRVAAGWMVADGAAARVWS